MNGEIDSPTLVIQNAIQGQWVVANILATSGATYIATAARAGQYGITRRTSAGVITSTTLATHDPDDHNVAAIVQTNTGKMLVAYAQHSAVTNLNHRLSASSDADDWGTERTLSTGDVATYAQLWRRAGQDRIFLLYRIGSSALGSWQIRYTDDEGSTWSSEVQLATNTYLTSYLDPDGVNLRCFAYDHPTLGTDHDIYYFRVNLSTGDVTDSAGTVYGNAIAGTSLPIGRSEQHKVVDVTNPTTTRLYEIGKVGAAALLASEFVDETAGTYYRYSYNGTTGLFTRQAIATSGPAFFATGSNYFGGCAFDESSLDTVYCARNVGASVGVGSWELVKMTTADSGATWQRARVMRTTANIIGRPQVKAGRLWWFEASRYVDFNDFSASVCSVAL